MSQVQSESGWLEVAESLVWSQNANKLHEPRGVAAILFICLKEFQNCQPPDNITDKGIKNEYRQEKSHSLFLKKKKKKLLL